MGALFSCLCRYTKDDNNDFVLSQIPYERHTGSYRERSRTLYDDDDDGNVDL